MRCYDACDMIWVEFLSQTLASYVMLRVHRVEVIFWWFKVLGNLQGAHCEYQKALDGNKSDSYAHKAVDGPRKFIAWTARTAVVVVEFYTTASPLHTDVRSALAHATRLPTTRKPYTGEDCT